MEPGDLFGLLTGALGGLELLQFFGPDEVVEELPKQVQPHGESQANHEENDALGQVQHVQHRIHPDAAKVTDHVQPPQIARHKDAQPGEAGLARRILPEAGANLQDHKDHNVRVHHMVQPTVERKRKKFIKFKLHKKNPLAYPGKTASSAFGNTSSRSMAISVQKVTPTFSATGNANAASM